MTQCAKRGAERGAKQSAAERKIAALLAQPQQRVDLTLRRMELLLRALGSPHLRLPPIIHIAGTNGKGSASAFCRAFLEAAGYSAHIHTSPHLVHWHERVRLGSKDANSAPQSRFAENSLLAEAVEQAAKAGAAFDATIFETVTAAAFLLFARFPADALVLEVGLGGRFDATNAIPRPAASLIMPIGLDHQSFLGATITQIAAEKAGIIKPHCPVICARQNAPQAEAAIRAAAAENHAPLSLFERDYSIEPSGDSLLFRSRAGTDDIALRLPQPRLQGAFQRDNAAAALQAVLAAGFRIPPQAAQKAMRQVYWPGRLQKLESGNLRKILPPQAELWLDGGHNPAAGAMLAEALKPMLGGKPLYLVCAMLGNKDCHGFLRPFVPLAPRICAVPIAGNAQSRPPAELAGAAQSLGLQAETAPSLRAALAQIAEQAETGAPPIALICGSLYLAGQALAENGTEPR